MKTRLIIVMILSALLALDATARSTSKRVVIISDVHLLSPDLVTPGAAIDRADAGETKMMAQSDAIMTAITDSIINLEPAVVLITGDLTHNGERASHERMAEHLERMAAHGIKSLVIPGNHDCNNPYAQRFDGDRTSPVPTVSRNEFAQIYHNHGYGSGSRRDTASLSYCCEPIDGIVIIGIDSNMDEHNTLVSQGDTANSYHNSGRIKPETLKWVIDQAALARQQGKQVIAMMHHHLVPHFDREDQLLPNYIIKDHREVALQLMQAGIHIMFTGHLHVTDAATYHNDERTDSIVEIATGSAICYPFSIRTATIEDDYTKLAIDTRWLTATDNCPSLREQGRERIINAMPGLAAMISGKAWNRIGGHMGQLKAMIEMGGGTANLPETPQQATQLTLRHLSEVFTRAMLAVVEGNEHEQDTQSIIEQGKQGIYNMIKEVAPSQADALWEFFISEVYPKLEPMVTSLLNDGNSVDTPNASHTDDLQLSVKL